MRTIPIKDYPFGIINTLEEQSIPRGAASKSLNWVTNGDKIELRRGYNLLGDEQSGAGEITSLEVVRRSNGTEIILRTRGKKLEYLNSSDVWTEIGSDVLGTAADGDEISIEEYHSLAGDQIYINGPNGPYLKIMMANLDDYADIYNSTKNYKGRIKIKQNRTTLWGRIKDKTGIYLSTIDTENYTTVSAEVIGTGDGSEVTFANTLVFKAAGAKRTCFGITVTDGTESFVDNNDGTLTGSAGGTGTINYMTGAISVTFNTAPANLQSVTADYQWEDVTADGIADFTHATPRVAGEGTVFRQDDGGGNFQSIESYSDQEYCFHEKKTWVLELTSDDTNATNLIYREKVGIPNWRAAVSTAEGVYYLDDSDEKDPQIKLLSVSLDGDKVLPKSVSKGFIYKNKEVGIDLSDYYFDQTVGREWGDNVLFACREIGSAKNNRLIVINKKQKSIDVLDYYVNCMAVYGGTLIAGDPVTDNVYTLFSGFDDDDADIGNYWEGNKDNLDFEGLKKVKKLRMQGEIGVSQELKVYAAVDDGPFIEIGTIEGNGDYVDVGTAGEVSVGRVTIGRSEVGGGGEEIIAYNYLRELRLSVDKFRVIKLKFEALALGYISVSETQFYDIRWKSYKIPKKYRT